jgi:5'-nucleotidase
MKLLLSNDDGIPAKGLRTLIEHLAPYHDVYVVAPDRERSAMGHALTLHKPIRIESVPLPWPVALSLSTSGTPSDCVKLALSTLLPERGVEVDWVISGINHGPNLGADVMYSGTVSAALEGAIFDKPSLAISLFNGHEDDANFHPAAQFVARELPKLATMILPRRTILNVNFPPIATEHVVGVQTTKLGLRMYEDSYEKRVDPRGGVYYWLAGEIVQPSNSDVDDVAAIRNNYVSITPVHLDMTNHTALEGFAQQLNESY